jgi:hypothetical protein
LFCFQDVVKRLDVVKDALDALEQEINAAIEDGFLSITKIEDDKDAALESSSGATNATTSDAAKHSVTTHEQIVGDGGATTTTSPRQLHTETKVSPLEALADARRALDAVAAALPERIAAIAERETLVAATSDS